MTISAPAFLICLALGFALGWLVQASRLQRRVVHAEARLAALTGGQETVASSLALASEDSAKRHAGALSDEIAKIVDPLRDSVVSLSEHVEKIESNRQKAYASLTAQVDGMQDVSRHLAFQTTQLVSALRAPNVRGRWGEMQLQRVVELAGMKQHCDFDVQASAEGVRPDMVIHLAGGRHIVVDAKVPFAAFLDANQAATPTDQQHHLRLHAKQVRAHVDVLAAKAYWDSFSSSPEFVVMFLPGDQLLDGALGADSALLEYAFGRNVVLATPSTLVTLLRTAALTWRQDALSRDAAVIQQLGKQLYERIKTVGQHFDRVGVALGKSVDAFNQSVPHSTGASWSLPASSTSSSISRRKLPSSILLTPIPDHPCGTKKPTTTALPQLESKDERLGSWRGIHPEAEVSGSAGAPLDHRDPPRYSCTGRDPRRVRFQRDRLRDRRVPGQRTHLDVLRLLLPRLCCGDHCRAAARNLHRRRATAADHDPRGAGCGPVRRRHSNIVDAGHAPQRRDSAGRPIPGDARRHDHRADDRRLPLGHRQELQRIDAAIVPAPAHPPYP